MDRCHHLNIFLSSAARTPSVHIRFSLISSYLLLHTRFDHLWTPTTALKSRWSSASTTKSASQHINCRHTQVCQKLFKLNKFYSKNLCHLDRPLADHQSRLVAAVKVQERKTITRGWSFLQICDTLTQFCFFFPSLFILHPLYSCRDSAWFCWRWSEWTSQSKFILCRSVTLTVIGGNGSSSKRNDNSNSRTRRPSSFIITVIVMVGKREGAAKDKIKK